ncbi:MAG: hypothetical protein ACE5FI_14545 [Anaerolineales bacterium]
MSKFAFWLPLYWFVLLPVLSIAAAVLFANQLRVGYRRGLIQRGAFAALLLALVASQLLMSAAVIAGATFESARWPHYIALAAIVGMAVATRAGAGGVHPGLAALLRPMPRDGLAELASPRAAGRRLRWAIVKLAPWLPALALGAFVLAQQPARWPGRWLLLLLLAAPLTIIPVRRFAVPAVLAPFALVGALRAYELRAELPAGVWSTPVSAARCSTAVRFNFQRDVAWCVDAALESVYQFAPRSGVVGFRQQVDFVEVAFAGETDRVWVRQNPINGLLLVDGVDQAYVNIILPRQGAVDGSGRLWFIDGGHALGRLAPGGGLTLLNSADGPVSNTANVVKVAPDGSVWVGATGGVSHLTLDSDRWETLARRDGVPGPVHDVAIAPDGGLWLLWVEFAGSARQVWGVSEWKDGVWRHIPLGRRTGLDAPTSQDAIAVDGLGRVWFTAVSYAERRNYLGIVTPEDEVMLYSLGPFVSTDGRLAFRPSIHGVVSDGAGGVYLYNPSRGPLRHWRP